MEVLDGSKDIPFGMLSRQRDDLDAGVLGILQPRQVKPCCSSKGFAHCPSTLDEQSVFRE
jgi:hypothetical protein